MPISYVLGDDAIRKTDTIVNPDTGILQPIIKPAESITVFNPLGLTSEQIAAINNLPNLHPDWYADPITYQNNINQAIENIKNPGNIITPINAPVITDMSRVGDGAIDLNIGFGGLKPLENIPENRPVTQTDLDLLVVTTIAKNTDDLKVLGDLTPSQLNNVLDVTSETVKEIVPELFKPGMTTNEYTDKYKEIENNAVNTIQYVYPDTKLEDIQRLAGNSITDMRQIANKVVENSRNNNVEPLEKIADDVANDTNIKVNTALSDKGIITPTGEIISKNNISLFEKLIDLIYNTLYNK